MKNKVVTLGEIMMRLSTPGFARFTQAERFNAVYGGSEANVAVSLSNFGISSEHITRLPDNDLGKAVIKHLRSYNVATDHILFGKERLGLYFLENGAMQRPPRIIYDRYDSAFAHIKPGSINWKEVFSDAAWFHWTGITPAISEGAAEVCKEAIYAAAELGITISGDINYRRNLWQYGKTADNVMPELVSKTNIIIAGLTDFKNCLSISADSYEQACEEVIRSYPIVRKISYTHRDSISASHNKIQGVLWNGKELVRSNVYDLTHIVDRVGAGDAYMAGLIYGWVKQLKDEEVVEFASAACVLKHSVEGDANSVTVEEVEVLMKGDNTGKLLR